MNEQKTCQERIEENLERTMNDIRFFVKILDADSIDEIDNGVELLSDFGYDAEDFDFDEKYSLINEYGLEFSLTTLDQTTGLASKFCNLIDEYDYDEKESAIVTGEALVRWGLSWGGPADGFLILYENQWRWTISRIIYYFQDWFDGARYELSGQDFEDVVRCAEALVDFDCLIM